MADNEKYLIEGHYYQYDLKWLIDKLLEFEESIQTIIDLQTIHYADPIQWDITTQYSPNTVVVNPKNGTAYMSKRAVPVGIQLDNEDYWVVIFNYQKIYEDLMAGVAYVNGDTGYANKDILVNDLVWDGTTLYRATRAISTGSKIIPGTNVVKTNIESLLTTYYGRDRTAQVTNDTLNVSGDYTVNAGDIAETSDNRTIKVTQDYVVDVDGNSTETVDGTKAVKASVLDVGNNPIRYGDNIAWVQDGVKGMAGFYTQSGEAYSVVTWIDPTLLNANPDDYTTPELHGAKGDGVTDDTAAIQAAVDTGKTVIFSSDKTYSLDGEVQLMSGTHLEGRGALIKTGASHAQYSNLMMARNDGKDSTLGGYTQNSNIVIRGLRFDGSKRPLIGGIGIGHATNVAVLDCEFFNWASWHPIEFNSTRNGIVSGCYFHDMMVAGEEYGECVQLDMATGANVFMLTPYDGTPCRNIQIVNNRFDLPTTLHNLRNVQPAAIGCHNTEGANTSDKINHNILIANNVCYGAQTFVLATSIADCVIANNVCEEILCAVYSAQWDGLLITGNRFKFATVASPSGTYNRGVYTNAGTANLIHGTVTVEGNEFINPQSHCIALSGTRCKVSNNVVRSPKAAGIYASYAADHTEVIGNVVTDESSSGNGIYVNGLSGTKPVSVVMGNYCEKLVTTNVATGTEKSVVANNVCKTTCTVSSQFLGVNNVANGAAV